VIAGVLLAAGRSSRMGSPKALARAGRESFAARGIRGLWTTCDRVVVVLGADAPRIRRAIEGEFESLVGAGRLAREMAHARAGDGHLEAAFVVNRAWRRGMFGSARAGLAAALRGRPEAVLVMPVDHPGVAERTVADVTRVMLGALAACPNDAERARFSYALVPRYRRQRGHPLVLSPALARAVAADGAAANLSDAVRRNARLVGYLDVTDAGVVRNRNTPRD
jgi:CTP:molybdopterin cytidylyltransferase MocA